MDDGKKRAVDHCLESFRWERIHRPECSSSDHHNLFQFVFLIPFLLFLFLYVIASVVLGFNLCELWVEGEHHLTLARVHVDEVARKIFAESLESYQTGMKEKASSLALCKKAMESKDGFYWRMRQNSDLHREFPIHTAVSFHLSRDNINTNVFVVAYSFQCIKQTQSKMSFILKSVDKISW